MGRCRWGTGTWGGQIQRYRGHGGQTQSGDTEDVLLLPLDVKDRRNLCGALSQSVINQRDAQWSVAIIVPQHPTVPTNR